MEKSYNILRYASICAGLSVAYAGFQEMGEPVGLNDQALILWGYFASGYSYVKSMDVQDDSLEDRLK